jgi:hypothetical protein
VFSPLCPIAITLFYYDQRIQQEGFDIEWMMNAAGMNELVPDAAQALPAGTAPATAPEERPK